MNSRRRRQDRLHRTGQPWENCYCESFNSKLQVELLNGQIFYSRAETKIVIEAGKTTESLGVRTQSWIAGTGDGAVSGVTFRRRFAGLPDRITKPLRAPRIRSEHPKWSLYKMGVCAKNQLVYISQKKKTSNVWLRASCSYHRE